MIDDPENCLVGADAGLLLGDQGAAQEALLALHAVRAHPRHPFFADSRNDSVCWICLENDMDFFPSLSIILGSPGSLFVGRTEFAQQELFGYQGWIPLLWRW